MLPIAHKPIDETGSASVFGHDGSPKKRLELRALHEVKRTLRGGSLHSVCEEARCPNRSECFGRKTATFLAMGSVCTRACNFCSIATGRPGGLNPHEATEIARASAELGLRHVVVTSVNRDDLPDGGSEHLRGILAELKRQDAHRTTEVLTPDFKGDLRAVDCVLEGRPDVFNHNLETVPSLYKTVRPGARYDRSLSVLAHAVQHGASLVKTGVMVGLGETREELETILRDVAQAGIHIFTLGQYFQPTREQLPVVRYWSQDEFAAARDLARAAGIPYVYSGTFVRSSYNADEVFAAIAQGRFDTFSPAV